MAFLSPWLLLFAGALIVPILLHLTRRPSQRPVPFPSLLFFRRIARREKQRRKIQHPWLLLLRCLILLLLVAAFADPAWVGDVGALNLLRERQSGVIAVDVSMSMRHPQVRDETRRKLRGIVGELSAEDESAVLTFDTEPHLVQPWLPGTASLERSLSEALEPGFGATRLEAAFLAGGEAMRDARFSRRVLYVVSDFQKSGQPPSLNDTLLPPGLQIVPVDVGVPAFNLFVEDLRVESELFHGKGSRPITFRVRSVWRNRDPFPVKGVAALYLDDRREAEQPFTLDEGGEATLGFEPLQLRRELGRGRIELSSSPADDLVEDNTVYFILRRVQPFGVRLVGEPGVEGVSLLRTALEVGTNLPWSVTSGPAVGDLETNRVLIWYDRPAPPPEGIGEWVKEGGCLIVVSGPSVDPAAWDNVPAFPVPGEPVYVRRPDHPFAAVTGAETSHPFLGRLGETGIHALGRTEFYAFREIRPSPTDKVILELDGRPLLVERAVGAGKVLVFGSTADARWSDFSSRAAFVPFWHELVLYASGYQAEPSFRLVGERFAPRRSPWRAEGPDGNWNLQSPKGELLRPWEGGEDPYVLLPVPGYYELREKGTTDWIAVNVQPRESDISPAPPDELAALLRSPERETAAEDRITVAEGQSYVTRRFWWLLILAVLALLSLEAGVANRLPQVKADQRSS